MRRIIRRLENVVGPPERLLDVAHLLHRDWITFCLCKDVRDIDGGTLRPALPSSLNSGQRPIGRLVIFREYRHEITVSLDANHAWHVLRRRRLNFDETRTKSRAAQDARKQH